MAHQDRLDMVLILGHALSHDLEQVVVLKLLKYLFGKKYLCIFGKVICGNRVVKLTYFA